MSLDKNNIYGTNNTIEGVIVSNSSNTIPSSVEYKNRVVRDKWWALLYVLSYLAFLSCGFFLVSQAKTKYVTNVESGSRYISDHFKDDAQKCCDESNGRGSVCYHLEEEGNNNRRYLQAKGSKLDADEGIFEAFIEAPEIIATLLIITLVISTLWIGLLRFCSRSIVVLAEVSKVGICLFLAIYLDVLFFYVLAAISGLYTLFARKKLFFAAKIMSQSTRALAENPNIFTGAILTKLCYVGNAVLFVVFFSQSFNVVEVQKSDGDYCEFAPPSYTSGITLYLCISYLWTILCLDFVRLSIIATIVGSWHFHPHDKPGILVALKNVGTSIGTISICSLIATVAEWIKRELVCNSVRDVSLLTCCFFPLQILLCLCSSAVQVLISTYTKFSLILHVFKGDGFFVSSKSAFQVLSRHFKGGFVTEMTSRSVLYLASYSFSLALAMITWAWIADRFDCVTIASLDTWLFIMYILIILFNLYYPVIGLYVLLLVNKFLKIVGRSSMDEDDFATTDDEELDSNRYWIPPLAACFVGCLAMMMFSFLSAVFLDIIDTLFLCFAIDKDNRVDVSDDVFCALVKELPEYIEADDVVILDPEGNPSADSAIALEADAVPHRTFN